MLFTTIISVNDKPMFEASLSIDSFVCYDDDEACAEIVQRSTRYFDGLIPFKDLSKARIIALFQYDEEKDEYYIVMGETTFSFSLTISEFAFRKL